MKLRVLLIAAAGLLLSAGCGNDKNQESQVPWIEDETQEQYLVLGYYLPKNATSEAYPRLTFECEGWRGAEIAYDSFGTDKVDYFYFCNTKTNRRFVVSVTDKSMTIAQGSDYDIFNSQNLNAVVATIDGNKLRCAEMHIWGENSGYEPGGDIVKVTEMPWDKTKTFRDVMTKGQTEDMVRQTFYDMFEWMGEKISKIGDYVEGSASELCTLWTEVVIPVAELNLYVDDPDKLKEVLEYKKGEKIKSWVISTIGADELVKAKDQFASIWSQYGGVDSATKEQAYNILGQIKGIGSWLNGYVKDLVDLQLKFQIDLQAGNLTETSATITGSVNNEENIGYTYLYVREKGGHTIFSDYPQAPFPFSCNLTNLRPGATYQVTLNVYDTSYSTPQIATVEFKTPNYFQLDPESVHVGGKGDEYAFFITLPDENWRWEIVSQPAWCYLSGKGNAVFKMKIAATPTARTGEIVVEAKNGSESRTATISIVQDGLTNNPQNPSTDPNYPSSGVSGSWNGHTWQCVDSNLSLTGSATLGWTEDAILNFWFICHNATTGDVESNAPWTTISLVGSNLEFHYTGTIEGVSETCLISVAPPQNGRCTGSVFYTANGNIQGQSVNVKMTGSIIMQQAD